MKIGEFQYNGNGTLLEQGENYTIFKTENGYLAFPEGEQEGIPMNSGTFVSLRRGNLQKMEGATPMR